MGGRAISDALELLRDLPANALQIRARAVRALSAQNLGDGAGIMGFSAATATTRHPVRWGVAEGGAVALYELVRSPRSAVHAFKLTDLRLARTVERRRFRTIAQLVDREALLQTPTWTQLFAPVRTVDMARLVVVRDDEVVAFAYVTRSAGAPLFGPTETRALQELVGALRRALIAADSLEHEEAPDGPAHLVLDALGRVLFASLHAREWLSIPGFGDRVADLVRAADRQRVGSSSTVGPDRVDLVRVHDEGGGVRYLAHVASTRRLRLAPAAVLTVAQQRVASLVVSGATLPEVSDMMERSAETVRSHLKAIYERLGVTSRAELARALESDEPA